MRRIILLPAGQVEGDHVAVEVGLRVDLGGNVAARAAGRLPSLPPLAPASETWVRTMVLSNIRTRCADDDRDAR